MRKGDQIRLLEAEVRKLTAERDTARQDHERVIVQRDELRRLTGNIRSIVRQEAESAVAENLGRRESYLRMRPTVALAAHLADPEPVDRPHERPADTSEERPRNRG